jgi:hypothetical protein
MTTTTTTTCNVHELTGTALDYAVARALGKRPSMFIFERSGELAKEHRYSTDRAQAGPIIEREGIATRKHSSGTWYAMAQADVGDMQSPSWVEFTARGGERYGVESWAVRSRRQRFSGPTLLIAGLRCYVASKLGATIEIPTLLLTT